MFHAKLCTVQNLYVLVLIKWMVILENMIALREFWIESYHAKKLLFLRHLLSSIYENQN